MCLIVDVRNVYVKIVKLWCVTEKATMMDDGSLKRLLWRVTEKAKKMGDGSLKMLLYHITEKTTLTSVMSLKRLPDISLKKLPRYITVKATMTGDMSLKKLPRYVTGNATIMGDMSLKRLPQHVTANATLTGNVSLKRLPRHIAVKVTLMWHMFLLSYIWGNYSLLEPIKTRHEGRNKHTHKSETMGSKESEPWPPRWVRQQLRERQCPSTKWSKSWWETSGQRRKTLMQMRLWVSIPHEFRLWYVRLEVLVLPSAHLPVLLGLRQRAAEEGSFSFNIYNSYS
jgi:hypothetical protein